MQIYNTLNRKKEELQTIEPDKVKIYSCGPTVYDFPHIGNLRAFIFADTLRRALEFLDYEVVHVMNITDVGHLVSDEDDGEDKMEKAAKREQKDPYEIALYYENVFKENLLELNIKTPSYMPRATEHIEEQIAMIQKLFENDYAYITEDGIYFDVSKFKKYGDLSGQKLEEKEAGSRIKVKSAKRNPQDFALWKFLVGENKNHIMHWDSPWQNPEGISQGFPGWHIECSAMGMKYLGETFDIHTGGVDHIPVHHENEIAQSEGATGKKFVNYWMHNDFLRVDGGKMSKSLGNFYKLQDLLEKGLEALDYRYFCLTAHYRSKLNFTWEALESAKNGRKKLMRKINELKNTRKESLKKSSKHGHCLTLFKNAIKEDLNTAQALAVLWDTVKDNQLSVAEKLDLVEKFENVLGLNLLKEDKINLPQKIIELAEKRKQMRVEKNWEEADRLRELIEKEGYLLEDVKNDFKITKKK